MFSYAKTQLPVGSLFIHRSSTSRPNNLKNARISSEARPFYLDQTSDFKNQFCIAYNQKIMKERDLISLENLARYGSFVSAAERMKVAQPYLSKYVREMEARYGAALVDRTTKPVTLTAVGQGLLERLREIDVLTRRAVAFCQDHAEQPEGTIRLASNPDRTVSMLAPVMGVFAVRYPKVIIDCSQNCQLEQVPGMLLQGGADIGITFESLMTPDLNGYALAKERLLLAVPTAAAGNNGNVFNTDGLYPSLTGRESFLESLPLLVMYKHEERVAVLSQWVHRPLTVSGIRTSAANFRLSLAAEGAGYTIVQEHLVAANAAKDRCRFYSLEGVFPVQTVVLAWPSKGYLSSVAARFCTAVKDHWQQRHRQHFPTTSARNSD